MVSRVLVVTHDANLLAQLRAALSGPGHEVLAAANAVDAMRRLKSEEPPLLVLALGVPAFDALGLVERVLGSEDPGHRMGVIVLGDATLGTKLRALRAGSDDYLAMPIHPVELGARIRRILARTAPPRPRASAHHGSQVLSQVLAFYGAKGGVGTTTLAINTAIALRGQRHRRVALVDANLQFGDHRVFLDVGLDRRSIVDSVGASSMDSDVLASIVVPHASGLDLLLAPPSP